MDSKLILVMMDKAIDCMAKTIKMCSSPYYSTQISILSTLRLKEFSLQDTADGLKKLDLIRRYSSK